MDEQERPGMSAKVDCSPVRFLNCFLMISWANFICLSFNSVPLMMSALSASVSFIPFSVNQGFAEVAHVEWPGEKWPPYPITI